MPATRLSSIYFRARKRISADGVLRGSFSLAAKVIRKLVYYECTHLFSNNNLGAITSEPVCKLPALQISHATQNDVMKFEYDRLRGDLDRHKLKELEASARFRAGQQCLLAEHGGRFVAKAWIAETNSWFISEVESQLQMAEQALVIFDCATLDEYHRNGIYATMLRYIVNRYPEQKKVIYCEKKNTSSRKAITRDFVLNKKLYLLKILGLRLRWQRCP